MSLRLPRSDQTGLIIKIRPLGVCGKKNYIAPEVLANNMNFNPIYSDIWSVGVMLFIMLTGCPPVEIANINDPRYRMVVRGDIGSMLQQWGINISLESIDLLVHILKAIPEQRYTIQQILAHPWMNMN
jgi:serine/threonine protein kinase